MPKDRLYVDNACKFCHLILREVNRSDVSESFDIADIHKDLSFRSYGISQVPAIVSASNQVYQGRDAFTYIKKSMCLWEPYDCEDDVCQSLSCEEASCEINMDKLENAASTSMEKAMHMHGRT